MISRRNRFGLGTALSVVSFCSSFSAPALAQDPLAGETPPAGDAAAAPPAAPPAEAPPADAPPAETPPAPKAPAAPPAAPAEKFETTAPTETMLPATSTASGTSVEREKTVSFVG